MNCIILRIRPARSAEAYKTVWTDEGSPLATITHAQQKAINTELKARLSKNTSGLNSDDLLVEWAMRYGQPSIPNALQNMFEQGVRKLVVLPLYPQYSASTSASTFDAIAEDSTRRRWIPELRFSNGYHDDPRYTKAVADSIREHWKNNKRADKLVMSFHGVPQRYLHNGDPYHCQCLASARLIAEELGLTKDDYIVSFQSLFGRAEWLRPYTDETLKSLPGKGVKSVEVVCPGFSADCLETIEEIDKENREYFMENGGQEFHYIPALNDSPAHINALCDILEEQMAHWTVQNESTLRNKNFTECPYNHKSEK